jgi:hypothetical protein
MATISFTVAKPGNVAKTLEKVKAEVEKAGGTLKGDTKRGTLTGKVIAKDDIQGNYTVGNKDITINVTKKPLVVPQQTVIDKITSTFKKCAVN